jgi:hypothetical protein
MDTDLYSKEGKSLFAGKNIDAAIESLTTMVIPRDYLIVRFPGRLIWGNTLYQSAHNRPTIHYDVIIDRIN